MKNQQPFFTVLLAIGIGLCTGTVPAQSLLTVGVWGDNSFGETTVPVAARSGVTAIAAADYHIVVLKSEGTLVAWGKNQFGEVTGTPATNFLYSATADPVTLHGQVLSGVTAIAAGTGFTLALKKDGSVVAWGFSGPELTVPVAAQSGVTAIAAGSDHILALKNDGSVVA